MSFTIQCARQNVNIFKSSNIIKILVTALYYRNTNTVLYESGIWVLLIYGKWTNIFESIEIVDCKSACCARAWFQQWFEINAANIHTEHIRKYEIHTMFSRNTLILSIQDSANAVSVNIFYVITKSSKCLPSAFIYSLNLFLQPVTALICRKFSHVLPSMTFD